MSQPPAVAPRVPVPPVPPVLPLRPMTVADVLDGGFRLLRAAPAAILVPGLLVAVLVAVADTALLRAFTPQGTTVSVGAAVSGSVLVPLASSAVGTVGVALVGAFVAGALLCTLQRSRPTLAAVWCHARGRLPVAFAVGVVVAVTQTVGLVFLLLPGVGLWALWALAVPATVVERASVSGALRRSVQLQRPGFWRVFGLRLLGVLSSVGLGYLFRVPFTLLAGQFEAGGAAALGLSALGTLLASAVVLPLRAALDVVLYLDQRIRTEAFDVTLTLAATRP